MNGHTGQGRVRGFAHGNAVPWKTVARDATGLLKPRVVSGRGSCIKLRDCGLLEVEVRFAQLVLGTQAAVKAINRGGVQRYTRQTKTGMHGMQKVTLRSS
jgi:hypothetical protein